MKKILSIFFVALGLSMANISHASQENWVNLRIIEDAWGVVFKATWNNPNNIANYGVEVIIKENDANGAILYDGFDVYKANMVTSMSIKNGEEISSFTHYKLLKDRQYYIKGIINPNTVGEQSTEIIMGQKTNVPNISSVKPNLYLAPDSIKLSKGILKFDAINNSEKQIVQNTSSNNNWYTKAEIFEDSINGKEIFNSRASNYYTLNGVYNSQIIITDDTLKSNKNYVVRLTLDDTNAVDESNENDNTVVANFSIDSGNEGLRMDSKQNVKTPSQIMPTFNNIKPSLDKKVEIASMITKSGNDLESYLKYSGHKKNTNDMAYALKKYTSPLVGKIKMSQSEKYAINNFIVYANSATGKLNVSTRVELLKKYKLANGSLPKTNNDWVELLKTIK